jgi:signal transduction histidine kinase
MRHAVWPVAGAFGLGAIAVVRSAPAYSPVGDSLVRATVMLIAGWSLFLAAFLLSAAGRRGVALQLAAAGVAWFAAELASPAAGSALVFSFALVFSLASPAFVGWAFLAHPEGRLQGILPPLAVASALLSLIGIGGLVAAFFFDPALTGCARCPANLFLWEANTGAYRTAASLALFLGAVACVAMITLGALRLVKATPAGRRVISGPVVFGGIYLGFVTVSLTRNFEQGFLGTSPADRQLWLAQALAVIGFAGSFVWGQVRIARSRSSLARLAVEIEESERAGTVRNGLARAVGDESLIIAYPVGDGQLADTDGSPMDGRFETLESTPLISQGRTVAVLGHRGLITETELTTEIAPSVRLALDNERLRAEVNWRVGELQDSRRRVVAAMDAERRKLERDLHDGAQQRLITIALELGMLSSQADDHDTGLVEPLTQARAEVQRVIDSLRELARGIHPVVLTDYGLRAALDHLAETSPTPLTVTGVIDNRLPEPVETTVYRVVVESAKTGPTSVRLDRRADCLHVEVEMTDLPPNLVELADRVGAVGGQIGVDVIGSGSRIVADIPCG